MAYSPDGQKLAVGSHDNHVYIYSATDYTLLGTLKGNSSFIVSLDWSIDGGYIRTVSGAHELLFYSIDTMQQDRSGASNTVSVIWDTNTAKFGWCVDGIFPSGTDGTHINSVAWSKDE